MLNKTFWGIILIWAFTIAFTTCGSSPKASVPDELDMTLREVSDYLNESIPAGRKIAVINIQTDSTALAEYIIEELITNAVNDKIFSVVDRQQLDAARAELNFNMSGEVSDQSAQSVGQMLGAQTIIVGRVSQIGERYRLNIRALEVETVQVQGSNNWNIAAGATISALMGGGGGTQPSTARTTSGSTSTSGTTGTSSARIVPTVTSVTVSPDNISVDKGTTQEFQAIVSGNNDPDIKVTWTVTQNTSSKTNISEDGILTVGDDETITPLIVTATSTVDQSKNASVSINVPGGISAINVNNAATWNAAINRIRNGGNNQTYIINVTGNISVPSIDENLFGANTGLIVNIQGSGTISLSANGNLLRIGSGQTVIVRNITLRGRSDNNNPVVSVASGGIFRIEGNASITGNSVNGGVFGYGGGGIYVEGGTFTMSDNASVTGNIVKTAAGTAYGAGVFINQGSFIMQGGTISGNSCRAGGTADNVGGGVCLWLGTFTMEGGTISGNTLTTGSWGKRNKGAGVYVDKGTFTMKNGTISSNSASNGSGGGVYNSSGTFIMQDGTISGNTASVSGGGVYSSETFTMSGGTILHNAANGGNGGGIFIEKTFRKTGGIINGNDISDRNTASGQGHALYLSSRPNRWRNATAGPGDQTEGYGFWLND